METYVKTLDKALDYFATVSKGKEIGARLSIILDTFFKNVHAEYSVRDMLKIISQHEGFEKATRGQIYYTLEQLVMCGILGSYGKEEETITVDYEDCWNKHQFDRSVTNEDGSVTYHSSWTSAFTIYNPTFIESSIAGHIVYQVFGKRNVQVTRGYYYLKG